MNNCWYSPSLKKPRFVNSVQFAKMRGPRQHQRKMDHRNLKHLPRGEMTAEPLRGLLILLFPTTIAMCVVSRVTKLRPTLSTMRQGDASSKPLVRHQDKTNICPYSS